MPYTLSHSIVALPFLWVSGQRVPVPVAAIAIGSMSPDSLYLLALTTTGSPARTLTGVYAFCYLASLLVSLVWYTFLDRPTLSFFKLSPRPWPLNIWAFFTVSLAILFGISAHLLWDATSHYYGAFVIDSAFWHTRVFSLPLYKWNQYAGGVIGLLVLGLWYSIHLIRQRHRPYSGKLRLGVGIYTLSISALVVLANLIHPPSQFSDLAVHTSIGFMSGIAVAMCFYALALHLFERQSK